MFVSKHAIFLEKEFILRYYGSKVELEEVKDAQIDINQMLEPEAEIHRDEITIGLSEAQALSRSSRLHTILERWISH